MIPVSYNARIKSRKTDKGDKSGMTEASTAYRHREQVARCVIALYLNICISKYSKQGEKEVQFLALLMPSYAI